MYVRTRTTMCKFAKKSRKRREQGPTEALMQRAVVEVPESVEC